MWDLTAEQWLSLATPLVQYNSSARFQGAVYGAIQRAQARQQYQNDPESDFGKKQKQSLEQALFGALGG